MLKYSNFRLKLVTLQIFTGSKESLALQVDTDYLCSGASVFIKSTPELYCCICAFLHNENTASKFKAAVFSRLNTSLPR